MSNISGRQEKILYAVIKEYVATAEPVGSSILNNKYFPDISPATIRNELSLLEENNFLAHPHTSSGRVPTEMGYKHYINKLMEVYDMSKKEKDMLDFLSRTLESDMSHLLDNTLNVMSGMFNNVSVCQSKFAEDILGRVKDRLQSSRIHNDLQVKGLTNLISEPEFGGVENLRPLLNVIDDKQKLSEILRTDREDIHIKIGQDIGVEELRNCAVVSKSIKFKDETVMSIACIGPMRMRYSKAISVVAEVSRVLDNVIEEIL